MKKAFFLILSGIGAMTLSAQQETLFDDFTSFGAFGGPMVEISSINGEVGADVGGGGALVLDDFFIGGYGMGTDHPDLTFVFMSGYGDEVLPSPTTPERVHFLAKPFTREELVAKLNGIRVAR